MSSLDADARWAMAEHLGELVRRAGAIAMEVYATDFAVEYKAPSDPVTLADKRINALIVAELQRAYPGVPVVAEESPADSYQGYRGAAAAFFLDPIDGTYEFVHRTGQFCIMLGYVEAGRPVLGVIGEPTAGRLYLGAVTPGDELGGRAERIEATGERRALRPSAADFGQGVAVVSRSHYSDATTQLLAQLGVPERETYGSAGLKAMRVADGSALVYAHAGYAGSRWDAAAPEAICRAAGVSYTDTTLMPYRYDMDELGNQRGVLALPGQLHARAAELLASPR